MAGEDPGYLESVRALPCAVQNSPPCVGAVQAHHRITGRVGRAPVKGGDRRAHDHDSIPLCAGHHDAWHGARAPFRGMSKQERLDWEDEKVRQTQGQIGLSHIKRIPGGWIVADDPRGSSSGRGP